MGDYLKREKIEFKETEVNIMQGVSVTYQCVYEYTNAQGLNRWVFEFCERWSIDGYMSYSFIFDEQPSRDELHEVLKENEFVK